jgi:Rrf2 family protein
LGKEIFANMIFSKSFGYALRGVLYIRMAGESKTMVRLDVIARELAVPRHFLGKVMKKLVKEGVLSSQKGPYGGFCINEKTMETSLLNLVKITGEPEEFSSCVLRLRHCNSENPCPMHHQIESLRNQWQALLTSTTIEDLVKKDMTDFIKSIAIT